MPELPLGCRSLFDPREPLSLFVLLMQTLKRELSWLGRALSCSVSLLLLCLNLFLLRLFITAEDFRLCISHAVVLEVLEDRWDLLHHLSTTPLLVMRGVDPGLASRGIDAIG